MRRTFCCVRLSAILIGFALNSATALGADQDAAQAAKRILDVTGIRGGLVIHVGCGDGRLTAALGAADGFVVHGLARDDRDVRAARAYIRSIGLYGKVSAGRWSGAALPFVDNLASLVVSEEAGALPKQEILRVLRPGGVACTRQEGKWTKTAKPRPEQIDEWTHFLHDPSGNAVARDTAVGPPRRMQWVAAPEWSRNHHRLASVSSVVSAAGRVFYIVDEATAGSIHVPGRWSLTARDAFSGVQLWKRPIPSWAWDQQRFRSGPVQLPRLLVAGADRVYMPLGVSEAVSALDAATGEAVHTYEQTRGAEEIIVENGVLLVVTGSPTAEQDMVRPERRGKKGKPNTKAIVALRAASGELLWQWSDKGTTPVMPLTLAADARRAVFQAGGGVVCLDLASGKPLWNKSVTKKKAAEGAGGGKQGKKTRAIGWSTATLVVYEDVVLWAHAGKLEALSTKDAATLWESPCDAGFKSPVDVLVADGLVWVGPGYNVGRDPRSGDVKRRLLKLGDLRTAGHHHRCYREKATDRYIISGHRGMEFLALGGADHSRNNWVRGTCQYGMLPCNGLVYAPPHACGCYMESKLYGFWALAPEEPSPLEKDDSARLTQGPAYADLSERSSAPATREPDDWPTYRRDPLRTGATSSTVPSALGQAWRAKIGGRITAPVIANGAVLIAAIDEHRVVALAVSDGAVRWDFTAGGRVDSPPTIHGDLVLFGSADGYAYCLRLVDGELVWRFRAAPRDCRTVAFERVESLWPVHGSVLVANGVAYATAGRSSYLDGGIWMYGLDPATGKVLSESRISSDHPRGDEGKLGPAEMNQKLTQNATDAKTFQAPDLSDAFSMQGGATTDVLVSDGRFVYMRTLRFDRQCVRQKQMGRHLFSTSRLLDGHENHRSHWMIGTGDFSRIPVAYSWIANRPGGAYGSHVAVPYGLMLAFDEQTVWGVRRVKGYTLFAEARKPTTLEDEPQPDLRLAPKPVPPNWDWSVNINMRPRALVRAGSTLLIGGMPTLATQRSSPETFAGFEGRKGGVLQMFSAEDGPTVSTTKLATPPVWDGMAVAQGRLYVSRTDGVVECLSGGAASR